MKCPECLTELIRWPFKVDGKLKELWCHPDTPKSCPYKIDGTKITTEIIDEFMSSKFQELITKEGIKEEKPVVLKVSEPGELKEVSYLKTKLVQGLISVEEYDKIKERICSH